MKKGYLLFFAIAVLVASGCAKKEMVKGDEMIPPASAGKTAGEEKPAQPQTPVKAQPVREAQVKEAPAEGDGVSNSGSLSAEGLEKVYFDFDSYLLSPGARETLAGNAKRMEKEKGMKIRIEGNCDERGSDEYNLALGEKRAKSAMQYMVNLGVPAKRLSVISYGKEKPADPGHDETAWAKNRRDEFVVIAR